MKILFFAFVVLVIFVYVLKKIKKPKQRKFEEIPVSNIKTSQWMKHQKSNSEVKKEKESKTTPTLKPKINYNKIDNKKSLTLNSENQDDDGNFGASMVVGMVTDSAPLGYIAGGSIAGAIVGSMLSEPDTSKTFDEYDMDDPVDFDD